MTKLAVFLRSWALAMGVSLLAGAFTPDRDQDGYPDDQDRCPDHPGKRAAKGRPTGCPAVAKFTGFSLSADGATSVSVHLTDVTPVEVSQGGSWVSLLMKSAVVRSRDGWSPPASGSVLERAELLQDAEGARLNLHVKTRMRLSFHLIHQADGIVLEAEVPPDGYARGSPKGTEDA